MNKQAPFLNLAWNPNSATKIDICYSEMLNKIFCWMRKWSINPYLPYFYVYYASYAFPHDDTSRECVFTIRLPIY